VTKHLRLYSGVPSPVTSSILGRVEGKKKEREGKALVACPCLLSSFCVGTYQGWKRGKKKKRKRSKSVAEFSSFHLFSSSFF